MRRPRSPRGTASEGLDGLLMRSSVRCSCHPMPMTRAIAAAISMRGAQRASRARPDACGSLDVAHPTHAWTRVHVPVKMQSSAESASHSCAVRRDMINGVPRFWRRDPPRLTRSVKIANCTAKNSGASSTREVKRAGVKAMTAPPGKLRGDARAAFRERRRRREPLAVFAPTVEIRAASLAAGLPRATAPRGASG